MSGSFISILKNPANGIIETKYSSVVPHLLQSVQSKLEKTDIDQEVKQASISAMASIISVAHSSMNPQQIGQVITIFNDRLQNELTRDAALKAITKIALNEQSE